MIKSSFLHWLRFVKLIFSKGSIWIKPYNYSQHIEQLWESNAEARKMSETYSKPKKSLVWYLLYVPLFGPMIALLSHYRLQKKWPTYVYHWPEKKLAYIRISKNAGTSIQAAILQKQHPDIDVSKLSVNQINEMGKLYIKPYLEDGYECFTVVRNPLDRLLSCYFDQVVGREKRFYFDDYNFRIIKKGMPFKDFVHIVNDIPDSIKDLHFRPQIEYVQGIDNVKVFQIEKDEDQLNEYLRKFDLKLDKFNQNNVKVNIDKYYANNIKCIVEKIYKKDFDHFGYHEKTFSN